MEHKSIFVSHPFKGSPGNVQDLRSLFLLTYTIQHNKTQFYQLFYSPENRFNTFFNLILRPQQFKMKLYPDGNNYFQ